MNAIWFDNIFERRRDKWLVKFQAIDCADPPHDPARGLELIWVEPRCSVAVVPIIRQILVQSTVQLAHKLGIKDVEEAACLHYLRDLGCDCAQEYFISKPIPADDLIDFVATSSTTLAA